MGLLNDLLYNLTEVPIVLFAVSLLVILLLHCTYRLQIHPLSRIPGPSLPKLTSLWLFYHSYIGDESTVISELHKRYGSLVQVSPIEMDIADGDAIATIYINKGGFNKAPCYANFDFDGHQTIFSTRNMGYRNARAKAVVSLFSTKNIREGIESIQKCADTLVFRLQQASKQTQPVNLLMLTRSFAVDAVSAYIFQQDMEDDVKKRCPLAVSAYVDEAVAVGRLFYLPNWLFGWVEWLLDKCFPDEHVAVAMGLVDDYVDNVVASASAKGSDYPGRLLAVGLDMDEVKVQCKDLVFAGTDSSGMNIATILRQLVLNPERHDRLRKEIMDNSASSTPQDVQSLPYFSAVIKEAQRISMANPTRLPRTVPPTGWTYKDYHFPPGTLVGCSAYQLHFDESVFQDAKRFCPERWLENVSDEMNKSWFAFGAGPRSCIAKNLAITELFVATEKVVVSNVLRGARVCQEEIEVFEWFNAKVKGEKIEIKW